MDNDEIQNELIALGFLNESILEKQTQLTQCATQHDYLSGDIIYHAEQDSDILYVIREGLIKLVAHATKTKTRIVRLHKKGSVLGIDGIMDKKHPHTAIAINDVRVFQIPHFAINDWQKGKSELYLHLLDKWYEYINYADTWIADFSTGNIRGRVARLIQFLAKFETETGPKIVELLTTEEMGEILGVTPESVSRTIAEYKRDKLIEPIENNSESLFTYDSKRLAELCQH